MWPLSKTDVETSDRSYPVGMILKRLRVKIGELWANFAKSGRRALLSLVNIGLLCLLMAAGFIYYSRLNLYSSVSLRFDPPISGQAAYKARQYSISHSGDKAYWPTFWTEYTASLSSQFVTANATCIIFSGQASQVWPLRLIYGTELGATDGNGCLVSEGLAWRLWGGLDVVGKTVEVDGKESIVRGVFRGKNELMLSSASIEDESLAWAAAELSGGLDGARRESAESYAIASGLGKPAYIVVDGLTSIAGAMAALPLLILVVSAFSLIIRIIMKCYPTVWKIAPYLLLILFGALLPFGLGLLPEWIIPTRWSDFSFWSLLLSRFSSGLRELLSIRPLSRDVEQRILFIKHTGIMFFAVCISLTISLRWRGARN